MSVKELLVRALRRGQIKVMIRRMADCESQLGKFDAVWKGAVENVPFYAEWKARVLSVLMFGVALGGIGAMSASSIREGAVKFLTKSSGGDREVTTENLVSSRRGLIDHALYNFKQSPILGNGFRQGGMTGIRPSAKILSAPIEKGVWVVAILEEGGIIGEALFVVFLLVGIWGSAHRGAYMASAALFVAMLTNLGEFTFFSMSYTCGIIWAMVFVGLALDIRRIREESARAGLSLRRAFL